MNNVDARGMSCPQPVLMVKKAIDKGALDIEVLVDNNTAKNNVEKFLKSKNFKSIDFKEDGETTILRAKK